MSAAACPAVGLEVDLSVVAAAVCSAVVAAAVVAVCSAVAAVAVVAVVAVVVVAVVVVAVVAVVAEQTVVAFAVANLVVAAPSPLREYDQYHMEDDHVCESVCWFSMRELPIAPCLTV